ncbi:purine-nucleoside phosphorylase [Aeribacillus composti]|uniref:purine-nucleoside phosphorylase n=1 Tax=Aeribacillus composti TaxID=1868734 RepID=UPI00406A38A2
MSIVEEVEKASQFLKDKCKQTPEIGLVLGSGLGVLAEEVEDAVTIPYSDIPYFPVSTVEGHKGQFVIGELNGKTVAIMQGRFHFYEGYSVKQVTFPVRVMKALGIHSLIVTNAAGGINQSYQPGDLMLITDHINNMGQNPLIGEHSPELGDRFPDMSEAYDSRLIQLAKEAAKELGIEIKEGVYVANTGPSYETPAEIRMLRAIGGDAVGMSTVPEVIVANQVIMKVLGISCITNMAAGILKQPLTHEEVMKTAEMVRADFIALVKSIVAKM